MTIKKCLNLWNNTDFLARISIYLNVTHTQGNK